MDTESTPQPPQMDEPAPATEETLDAGAEDARFPVVGIGASAGGLQAFERFFRHLPAETGMAFVLVSHLAPQHESSLVAILQNYTRMEVMQVRDETAVRPNTVYVIPPGKKLFIEQGVLRIADSTDYRGRQAFIDLFFRSLAADQGEYAVGIILSGTGSDGTLGLKAIKEQAGVTLAQEPEDAEFDNMPRSAIATGLVDVVLPAAELAPMLVEIKDGAAKLQLPRAEPIPDDESDALHKIFAQLFARTGHDFTHYKRTTVLRRLARRMQLNQVNNLSHYLTYLRTHAEEVEALFEDMLISVTNFFRDAEAFELLEKVVIPKLFEAKDGDTKVRIWVAGCATGEEAYSIAMLCCEYAEQHHLMGPIQVFATDIDSKALHYAREGYYPDAIVSDVTPERLRRFFAQEEGGYRVSKDIRKLVLFAEHNLLKDPPFSKLDLVTCRNVLIYFNREVQDRILRLFHYALHENGYLFLGTSESVESTRGLFSSLEPKQRIFRRQPAAGTTTWLNIVAPAMLGRRESERSTEGTKRQTSFAELHQRLLVKQYAPPSVIVNEHYDIVHLYGRAGRYLQFGEGEPTRNILDMTPPVLRLELRTALYNAFQKGTAGATHQTRRVYIKINGGEEWINLVVQRIEEEGLAQGFAQVIFEEAPRPEERQPFEAPGDALNHELTTLETELRHTREQLQTVVEQYETSNEELQASNEELLAMNEELQSTTEELETGREELQSMNEELEASKEELQSTNEELITVNEELQNKIEELSHANSDLRNLITSTDIAVLFLSRDLTISLYTPAITELFNIIPTDLGRPLSHLTRKIAYDNLTKDAETVLATLAKQRREIQNEDGRWYMMQMSPYRTVEDRIGGVVITFVDINELKQARADLESLNQELEARVTQRTEQVHALSSALTLAEQWERRRIASVLHDHLQQLLYAVQMRTQLVNGELKPGQATELVAQIEEINTLLEDAIRATRALTIELNPPVLRTEGLDAGLRWLVLHMQNSYGLAVDLNLPADGRVGSDGIRMLLIQLVRELLFNVVKHAGVNRAALTAAKDRDNLIIQVEDKGVGFDVEAAKTHQQQDGHFGLFSVRERLALFGGRLDIDSAPGQGTRMTLVIPLLEGKEGEEK